MNLLREKEFEDLSLLLAEDVGPKAIQLLALVSNRMHGTSLVFDDPANFPFLRSGSFNMGSSLPVKENEAIIRGMHAVVEKAKIDDVAKRNAIENLDQVAYDIQHGFELLPTATKKQTIRVGTIVDHDDQKMTHNSGLFSSTLRIMDFPLLLIIGK